MADSNESANTPEQVNEAKAAQSAEASPEATSKQEGEQKQQRRRAHQPQQPNPSTKAEPADQNGTLLFGKYSYGVEILDPSLKNYVNLKPVAYPMSFRRTSQSDFSKAGINIIERLENSLMRGGTGGKVGGKVVRTKGRLQGKKLKVIKIIEDAFETINRQSGKNPVEILVRALENSAPIEDTTRVVYGGITSNVAVDISASRRLDIALRNLAMAAVKSAFNSKRTLSSALASELTMAASADINSYAIKRKNEIERMARSAK